MEKCKICEYLKDGICMYTGLSADLYSRCPLPKEDKKREDMKQKMIMCDSCGITTIDKPKTCICGSKRFSKVYVKVDEV